MTRFGGSYEGATLCDAANPSLSGEISKVSGGIVTRFPSKLAFLGVSYYIYVVLGVPQQAHRAAKEETQTRSKGESQRVLCDVGRSVVRSIRPDA